VQVDKGFEAKITHMSMNRLSQYLKMEQWKVAKLEEELSYWDRFLAYCNDGC
jgi:hypothetical protein